MKAFRLLIPDWEFTSIKDLRTDRPVRFEDRSVRFEGDEVLIYQRRPWMPGETISRSPLSWDESDSGICSSLERAAEGPVRVEFLIRLKRVWNVVEYYDLLISKGFV
jgi:hypothetical protein